MDFGDIPLGNARVTKEEKNIKRIDFHKVNLVGIFTKQFIFSFIFKKNHLKINFDLTIKRY